MRGLVRSLQELGHLVTFYEDAENWSLANLRAAQGEAAVAEFARVFPTMQTTMYQNGDSATLQPWLERGWTKPTWPWSTSGTRPT